MWSSVNKSILAVNSRICQLVSVTKVPVRESKAQYLFSYIYVVSIIPFNLHLGFRLTLILLLLPRYTVCPRLGFSHILTKKNSRTKNMYYNIIQNWGIKGKSTLYTYRACYVGMFRPSQKREWRNKPKRF